jgi:NAD(P)-dependent dehydrogenase (short-subunit alcohol dehydrogenase family)
MAGVQRVALVTGGANGIGRAICRHLLGSGWHVGIVDLPDSSLARHFPVRARNTVLIAGDVREEETAARAVAAIAARFGRLDALVSNAGIMIRKPLHRLTLAEWQRVIDTNLTATFLLVRAAEKALRKARGAIVTVASTRATMSEPNTESYSASKGGVVALTHALAISLGPDIRVNCVSPRLDRDQKIRRFAPQGPRPASRGSCRQTARCCRTRRLAARCRALRLCHRRQFHR